MISGIMAVACFISPNPSPLRWMVSGSPTEVSAIEESIRSTPGARVVAHAVDGSIAFARFELGSSTTYGDFIRLMDRRGPGLMSHFEPTVPTCADGRAEDVGDVHARSVIVGILGDAGTLAALRKELGWASITTFQTDYGREGLAFEPREQDAAAYANFVARSAEGAWPDAQVLLLQPPQT